MNPGARTSTFARWLLAIGLVVVPALAGGPAHAYWTGTATGTGVASAATLAPLDIDAEPEPYSDSVRLTWTEPTLPIGLALNGFRVERIDGSTRIDACGSSASALLPASATTCDVSGLPDGEYRFAVSAIVGTWTTSGEAMATVAADRTAPSLTLAGENEENARLASTGPDYRLYVKASAAGRVTLAATVADGESGPRSATFPEVSSAGWSHAAETVTAGELTGAGLVLRSSPFEFAANAAVPADVTVVASDLQDNETSTSISVVADGTSPTGGVLRVNGVDATVGGSSSGASGSFSVEALTPFAEEESSSESGLANSTLTLASASVSDGSCGTFGSDDELAGAVPLDQPGLSDGCYRYTLSGTDRVGNRAAIVTTVVVDTSAPVGGALRANATDAAPGGATSMSTTGTWTLERTDYSDPGSGMGTSVLRRSTAPLADGACGAFDAGATVAGSPGESSLASGCYRYTLTGTNAVGLTSAVDVTVLADREDPVGGAFSIGGIDASTAVPTASTTSGSVTIDNLSQFTDGQSGLASSTLTRAFATMTEGSCGFFGAEEAVPTSGSFTMAGLADGCHRFTLTGVDNAGRTSSVGLIVRVDQSAPVNGYLDVNGISSASGAMATTTTRDVTVTWTLFGDAESGMASALLRRTRSTPLSNGVCGANYGQPSTLQSGLTPINDAQVNRLPTAGRCYRYELSGDNALGLSSTTSIIVMYDSSGPSASGSLVVNGASATAAGRTTVSASGAFTIAQRRTFADSQSGVSADVITRQWAPLTAGACGTYDDPVVIDGVAPIDQSGLGNGCYLYTQTGTNGVGTSSTVFTTVLVDTTAPLSGSVVVGSATSSADSGSTTYSSTGTWTVDAAGVTDPESTTTTTITRQSTTTLSGGVCGPFGRTSTITVPRTESGLTRGCVRYTLTGSNAAGLTATPVVLTVVVDATAPTGGALMVNGTSATTSGSASNVSATDSFSVSSLTAYSDTHTGIADQSLLRTFGATCSTIDASSPMVLALSGPITQSGLAPGCYRYTLSATNGAGGTAQITTDVTVLP